MHRDIESSLHDLRVSDFDHGAVAEHDAAAMIGCLFENSSAIPGTDYPPLSDSTLSWTSLDLDAQTIDISILDNAAIHPATRSFLIRLVDSSGATIAPHSVIEVRILDDDDALMHADGLEGNCPS